MKLRASFLKRQIDKINKPLDSPKNNNDNSNKIRNERGAVMTDTTDL